MAITDSGQDQELAHMNHLWGIISELSEQLSQNRSLAVSLYGQADSVNGQAVHGQTGFVLRRFNLDKPKDVYESELERMNVVMTEDNHALQQDNKQLNALIKEYEQTLETVMSAFRNRAREVQERELAVIREFESRILSLQDEDSAKRLAASTAQSESLARLSRSFRQFMRSVGGEEVDRPSPDDSPKTEDFESWSVASSSAELALERDCELARLEKENEELRRMLGMNMRDSRAQSSNANEPPTVPSHDNRTVGTTLARAGSAGPYGTLNNVRLAG
ncbi:hypothetical protein PILCRDRAFT_813313 [Piloderma croceum F 1598]|uniref:Uncharacterized protein n=1 Tax=Piloderma croceum (strain F 1598) TaxID=765440 RepID=A0A0C3GFF7_PILCF|nr:hypothetical protein PILCRDRAFT_813313 [Piloderma croceum F 1598]